MLCRVARQSSPRWNALEYGNRGHGNPGVVGRQIPAYARPYSEGVAGSQEVGDDNSRACGTVTTNAPAQFSIDDLVDQLPRVTETKLKKTVPIHSSLLLLLLTPSYAQYALDQSLPLRVFKQLLGTGEWHKPLHSVTAVVDKTVDGASSAEGISFAWQHRHASLANASSMDSENKMALSSQKPGWLLFQFDKAHEKRAAVRETVQVQLPLAKTIFSTGLVSTLMHRVYSPDDSGALQCQRTTNSESFSALMPMWFGNVLPHVHAPLAPLTPARRITNVMGNIVRSVSSEASFTGRPTTNATRSQRAAVGEQPASDELEKAVSSYFASMDIQPQPVSVWALIVPSTLSNENTSDLETLHRPPGSREEGFRILWKSSDGQTIVNTALNSLLPAGARLRKVLSGGGGWGKKAGLISLDPDDSYSTRELRQDAGWEVNINEDLAEQQRQALGEIAKPDEMVMFFIAPEGLEGYRGAGKALDNGEATDAGAVFGSLPSSIDSVPDTTAQNDGAATVKYHADFLGALSEEGLAFTSTAKDGTVTKTKFDVPFSRFSVAAQASDTSPGGPATLPSGRREFSTMSIRMAKAKSTER